MGLLSILLVPVAFIAIITLFLVMTFGNRGFVPSFVQYGALAWLALNVVMGVVMVALTLMRTEVTIETAIVPVMPSLDVPSMVIDPPPSATIVSADLLLASYGVTGLSWWPRTLFALGIAIDSLIGIYLSWIVYSVARNLRTGSPFDGVSTHLIRFGSILFIGSFVSQMAQALGNAFAGEEALTIPAYFYEGDAPEILALIEEGLLPFPDWPVPDTLLGELSLAPIGIAVVLVLLGMVFTAGEKLARDTEGLV